MEETKVILKNVADCLSVLRNLDHSFIVDIQNDWEYLAEHTLLPKHPTSHVRKYPNVFFQEAFDVCKLFMTLCPVTGSKVPPLVSHQSQPDDYKAMTVVRTTAWLLGIEQRGEAGFFTKGITITKDKNTEPVVTTAMDVNLSTREQSAYVRDMVDEYLAGASFPDTGEMMKTFFTPRPIWWAEPHYVLAKGRLKRLYKDEY